MLLCTESINDASYFRYLKLLKQFWLGIYFYQNNVRFIIFRLYGTDCCFQIFHPSFENNSGNEVILFMVFLFNWGLINLSDTDSNPPQSLWDTNYALKVSAFLEYKFTVAYSNMKNLSLVCKDNLILYNSWKVSHIYKWNVWVQ